MPTNLLIVESPSKAKTLKKYLGKDFEILASYGHVRDLIPKQGAVDTANQFAMKYELIDRNQKHVDAIATAVKEAENIYLATDPDREGEAISWHILEILKNKRLLKDKNIQRVVFHEITQTAVKDAVANPRAISMDLVNAQQARRALDYLVGFNLSPLLWKKIRRGLSAGRVQSPALRLICERELEIRAFKQEEYWTIHLDSHKGRQKFGAKLFQFKGEKLEQFSIPNEARQHEVLSAIQANGNEARIVKVEKRKKTRSPAAPFTTSTMQQEAVRKLGMTTDRTMRTAQQLYEGIDVGSGIVGLITYMRTDSVNLANEAIAEIRDYIGSQFDKAYLPANPVTYKSKAKNAQEAHEAIRPTSILRTPELVKPFLSPEQFKLYEMIWKRTLSCQMAPAKFDTTSLDLAVGNDDTTLFRASGQILTFPGFIAVYQEDADDVEEDDEGRLPPLEMGDVVPVDKLYGEQHFTQPPPRYSEASLVKALEEFGIGRPSTYASIISTLKDREYVILDKKRFVPTDVGEVVNKFLTEHFATYVDYNFTAKLEDKLDEVSNGEREWIPVLDEFWQGFDNQVKEKQNISRQEITQEAIDEACPKCSKPLAIRLGKRGKFIGCTGYPECDYTRNLNEDQAEVEEAPTVIEGRVCPSDGGQLIIKTGRYGKFIGCANYPKCKHIEPLEKPKDTGVTCPECKAGTLIERKSRYGKMFYSCNTYPTCKYAVWNPPVNESCPKCGWPVLTLKTTKRRGTEKVCPQKECGFAEQIAPPEGS
ncbi:DNA topoisomerase-1 [Chitinivorax tropicus]|uniref:DNA topoisomerase 1 n=1 Tax=Chitinivorax tropicus TaxID=714531 RepID=A0A840MF97_9PROT|nr:type I DNA topoisomerase [Chitinivorax tropicus]MBB5017348.1 DNA topoisomerase-1 [Chitinivorax tropicus]